MVSMHFQSNHSWDCYETWWMHLVWCSPDLIDFRSYSSEFPLFASLWFVEQFPRICRQTTDRIRLKFGRQTHYRPSQAWLILTKNAVDVGNLGIYWVNLHNDTLFSLKCVTNHMQLDCLFNNMFSVTSKKTSKLCITGLLWGEYISDWWIPLTKGQ